MSTERTESFTLYVAHGVKQEGTLSFSYFSPDAGMRKHTTAWDLAAVRRMVETILADMGSNGIDVCRRSGADLPQFAKASLPAFRRVVRNCRRLADALLPEGLRQDLFRDRDACRLTLIVPLSLHFIPWEILSDGQRLFADQFRVLKLIA
jgi:hypothetical protein